MRFCIQIFRYDIPYVSGYAGVLFSHVCIILFFTLIGAPNAVFAEMASYATVQFPYIAVYVSAYYFVSWNLFRFSLLGIDCKTFSAILLEARPKTNGTQRESYWRRRLSRTLVSFYKRHAYKRFSLDCCQKLRTAPGWISVNPNF